MNDRLLISVAVAALVAIVTVSLHESHYRARRGHVLGARLAGLEARLVTLEGILTEDRLT